VEGDALAGRDDEVAGGLEVLVAERGGGAEQQTVGAGDGRDAAVDPPHPRHDRAVVAADDQLREHPHRAALALDDAHHVRGVRANRHAVHDDGGAQGV
jgi:hypothetical protein